MWSPVLLLATIAPLGAFAANCDILRLPSGEAWNGGGKGYISIPIHEDIQAWDLQIIFDRPVAALEQWGANQLPEGPSRSYSFSGNVWNNAISAGDNLALDFVYRWPVDEEAPAITSITFNSVELSLESCSKTTVAPTTIITTPKQATCGVSERKLSCKKKNGFCTSDKKSCKSTGGKVAKRACKGNACYCCIPPPATTTQVATANQTQTTSQTITTSEALMTTKDKTSTQYPVTTKAVTTTDAQTTTHTQATTMELTTLAQTTTRVTTSEFETTTEEAQTEMTPSSPDCSEVVRYLESWYGGWKGQVNIPITNNVQGWSIDIVFDKTVDELEQWSVNHSPSGSSNRYTLTGIDGYNSDLTAGSTLSFDFLYRYQGDEDLPRITIIKVNGQNVCGNGNGNGNGNEGTTYEPVTTIPVITEEPGEQITHGPTSSCESIGEAKYNYDDVLHKSLLFYEAQRSGDLPSDNRVPWRKDSAINDGSPIDLTGGYYDAGDYVKFGFPMAGTATVLAWGAIEYATAYEDAGEMEYLKDAVKWATDYFLKAHVSPNELYGQVGNGGLDHASWGRPEDMTMSRPAYKIDANNPGSELAGETAAALASAAILFSESDSIYAEELLKHAEQLYNFANTYQGKYSDSIKDAATYYNSWGGYNDELSWAAAWLYRATDKDNYLADAESHYNKLVTPNEFSWDDKTAGVQVLLAQLTNKTKYKTATESFCDEVINNKDRTPNGLVYFSKWGPLRYAANAAYICLRAADIGIKPVEYRAFGQKQIHYMLGDTGRSFVIGFGNNYPQRPHHRSSSCPSTGTCDWPNYNYNGPNPQTLVGALVGGPDANDNYNDSRDDYLANEVTTDYNAGFQSAVAALRQIACNAK